MTSHQEVWEAEMAALAPTAWEQWASEAEAHAGHSLDGDGPTDGYSLDDAYEAWQSGMTAYDYALATCQALAPRRRTK